MDNNDVARLVLTDKSLTRKDDLRRTQTKIPSLIVCPVNSIDRPGVVYLYDVNSVQNLVFISTEMI